MLIKYLSCIIYVKTTLSRLLTITVLTYVFSQKCLEEAFYDSSKMTDLGTDLPIG